MADSATLNLRRALRPRYPRVRPRSSPRMRLGGAPERTGESRGDRLGIRPRPPYGLIRRSIRSPAKSLRLSDRPHKAPGKALLGGSGETTTETGRFFAQ